MQTTEIELMAGRTAKGETLVEKIPVSIEGERCRLLRSPAFAEGAARGDLLSIDHATGEYRVESRSGDLALRIYGPLARASWVEPLKADLEQAGASLDVESPRLLVFSVHVSIGFQLLEDILNRYVVEPAVWRYGNVYHPQDGAPLNWWQAILAER